MKSSIFHKHKNIAKVIFSWWVIYKIQRQEFWKKKLLFQWDDKITTLPGLYFVTIGILNPLSKWSNQWLCTTSNLRMINLGFLILTFIVLSRLMQQIHGGKHVSIFISQSADSSADSHILNIIWHLQLWDTPNFWKPANFLKLLSPKLVNCFVNQGSNFNSKFVSNQYISIVNFLRDWLWWLHICR